MSWSSLLHSLQFVNVFLVLGSPKLNVILTGTKGSRSLPVTHSDAAWDVVGWSTSLSYNLITLVLCHFLPLTTCSWLPWLSLSGHRYLFRACNMASLPHGCVPASIFLTLSLLPVRLVVCEVIFFLYQNNFFKIFWWRTLSKHLWVPAVFICLQCYKVFPWPFHGSCWRSRVLFTPCVGVFCRSYFLSKQGNGHQQLILIHKKLNAFASTWDQDSD